jgi:hypothetical protein
MPAKVKNTSLAAIKPGKTPEHRSHFLMHFEDYWRNIVVMAFGLVLG